MRFRSSTEPPRLAQLLLALATPAGERRFVLSDLQEEYDERVHDDGVEAARHWYRRQARASLAPLVSQRLQRRLQRPFRRHAVGGVRARRVSALWRPSVAVPTNAFNRGLTMFDILRDVRQAARALAKKPQAMLVTVLSLALGIGVVTVAFSVSDALIFRSVTGQSPDGLVTVYQSESDGEPHGRLSFPDYLDVAEHVDAFATTTAYRLGLVNFMLDDSSAAKSHLVQLVTGDYFKVTGESPMLGRGFLPEETRLGEAQRVIVVSHDFWLRRLEADPDVLGRSIRLDGHAFTVVGVARRDVRSRVFGMEVAAYVPLGIPGGVYRATEDELQNRSDREYIVMARLGEGFGEAQANAQLEVLSDELHGQYTAAWQDDRGEPRRLSLLPDKEATLAGDMGGGLMALAGLSLLVSGAILALACSNAASLFLARAHERRREMAVRLALGSSRRRLVLSLLVESLLPALVAGLLGFFIARFGVGTFDSFMLPIGAEIAFDFRVDHRAFLVTLGLAVLTSLIFGLAPALEGARTDLVSGLKSTAEGRPGRFSLRRLLVIGQIAGSLIFLLGAGLGLRGVGAASQIDVGFQLDEGATMSRILRPTRFSQDAMFAYLESERQRLLAHPEITEVHWTGAAELSFLAYLDAVSAWGDDGTRFQVARNAVTPGYLEARDIDIVRGRSILDSDRAGAPEVAVVNAAFARMAWPGENPLGQSLRIQPHDSQGEQQTADGMRTLEIVGVATDGYYADHSDRDLPYLWMPLAQAPDWRLMLHVNGPGSPASLAMLLEREVEPFVDEVTLVPPTTYRQMVDVRLQDSRIAARILAGSGLFGVVLATLGIYGLLSFVAVLRRREMAIRQAIGADRGQVFKELLSEGLRLACWGLGLGLAVALPLAHLARGVLYGVSPLDPVAVGASVLMLLFATVLAGLLPARRLADDSPVERLRAP